MISVLQYIAFALQLGVGIVFLLAALPKLRHPLSFARNVAEYKILPTPVSFGLGLALIPLELFLAIAFITGYLTELALPLGLILLILFLVAVGINLRRGRKIACGCFGNADEQISPRTLVRLMILLSVVLVLLGLQSTRVISLIKLEASFADLMNILYLAQTIIMAGFGLVFAAWLFELPKWGPIVRRLFRA